MLLKFVLVLAIPLAWAKDTTLLAGAKGEDVVCETVKKIENSGIFSDDKKILRRIAYVESKFGTDGSTNRRNYDGGIWRLDEIAFQDAIISDRHPNLDRIWPKIEKLLNKRRTDIKWEDLRKPLFSGVFARIKLYLVKYSIPIDINDQAKYWKTHYNTELGKGTVDEFRNRIKAMNDKFGSDCNVCKGRMNLAIVMDGSASIGAQNYLYAKQSAINLINTFSNTSVDIGYVLFSTEVDVLFELKSNWTRDKMKKVIEESYYPDRSTQTDLAINDATTTLSTADDSTGIPKVMAIFTDGNPNDSQLTILAAEQAKKSNIIMFAVAIGDSIDENNLKAMASQESYVIPVASYQELTQFFDKINSKTCGVPQTPAIGAKMQKDQLGRNEKRYFKFPLPSQGITVTTYRGNGSTRGYYSYTNPNPSSAINDGEFTGRAFIPPRKPFNRRTKRENENEDEVYVYITVEGLEDDNTYSLDTSEGDPMNSCKILPLSAPQTIGLVKTYKTKNGICKNVEPIEGYAVCNGTCGSNMPYNESTNAQYHSGECCRMNYDTIERVQVSLNCEDGTILSIPVLMPTQCTCISCNRPFYS